MRIFLTYVKENHFRSSYGVVDTKYHVADVRIWNSCATSRIRNFIASSLLLKYEFWEAQFFMRRGYAHVEHPAIHLGLLHFTASIVWNVPPQPHLITAYAFSFMSFILNICQDFLYHIPNNRDQRQYHKFCEPRGHCIFCDHQLK